MSEGVGSLPPMLTAEQRAVIGDPARRIRLLGSAGTGKSTVLLRRFAALAERYGPDRVLLLCRNRPAAAAARDTLALEGGFDALPVTTVHGVAFDLLARRGDSPPRLLMGGRQRALVRRLLAAEHPAAWPVLGEWLARPALANGVAEALLDARRHRIPDPSGPPELAAFARRYEEALAREGAHDEPGLLVAAAAVATTGERPCRHVLVDDFEALDAAARELVGALARSGGLTVAANPEVDARHGGDPGPAVGLEMGLGREMLETAVDHHLTRPFRTPPPPEVVTCGHPALEAEAVAGELLAARRGGVAWADMAVLVRSPARRAPSIRRALARHGVPTVPPAPGDVAGDPLASAVLDLLRWAAGAVSRDDERRLVERLGASPLSDLGPSDMRRLRTKATHEGDPLEHEPGLAPLVALRDHVRARAQAGDRAGDLAYEVWARAVAPRKPETSDSSLDALVALVDGLAAHADAAPGDPLEGVLEAFDEAESEGGWWRRASPPRSGVTVSSFGAAAGREWHTVVVAGCVDGEVPRLGGGRRLGRSERPAERAARLAGEAGLFRVATTRATGRTVAVAAPEPGVLVSRYLEAWPRREARLPPAPGAPAAVLAETRSDQPVWPAGQLVLSASQLDTYDDCPLRYAFDYVLRARGDAGVHAALGTLVHQVLAEWLAPGEHGEDGERVEDGQPPNPTGGQTRQAFMDLAARRWRDDIARFRPQVEEARRDYFDMLAAWWAEEGDPERDPAGAGRVAAVEHRFDVPLGPHRLVGAIDRVDVVPGPGGHDHVRVVDYKTGKREPSQAEVDDDLQLALYHLAAHRDPELSALAEASEMRLVYLRSMHRYDVVVADSQAQVAATEGRVLARAAELLDERFEPSVDATCRHCDFHRLCPLQPEGRQVGGA